MKSSVIALLLATPFLIGSCHALLSVEEDPREAVCGDGVIEGDELCDTAALGGETCQSQGYPGGALACSDDCTALDTSSCDSGTCGNGQIDDQETCDGTNLNEETCVTQGFMHGNLFCDALCSGFDTTQCSNSPCGNGEVDTGEVCDDGFTDECGSCNSDCSGPGTGSTCGDGIVCPETEVCDDGYTDVCGSCNDSCTNVGTGAICGDGVVCPETEACDDGFTDSCGTCNASCTGAGSGAACGDGVWCAETEGCDDQNLSSGDGCDSVCVEEAGWICTNSSGELSSCVLEGDLCPGISIGAGIHSGNTAPYQNDFPSYQGESAMGPDMVYQVSVPPGEFVRAILHNVTFDAVLVFTNTCPPQSPMNGLYSNNNTAGGVETLAWQNNSSAPMTLYILLDGASSADHGPYTLEIATGTAQAVTGSSPIAFNEYNPHGYTVQEEWVELYHNGTTPLNLKDAVFQTDSLTLQITQDVIVLPTEYMLLVNWDNSGAPGNPMALYGWHDSLGVIYSTTDTLSLSDSFGNTIDVIGPFDQPDWPTNIEPLGSIRLIPSVQGSKTGNDQPINWAYTDFPTPGSSNN